MLSRCRRPPCSRGVGDHARSVGLLHQRAGLACACDVSDAWLSVGRGTAADGAGDPAHARRCNRDLARNHCHGASGARSSIPICRRERPHLPLSPILQRMGWNRRLEALARHRDLAYSRYADDLAFSGDRTGFGASPQRFVSAVAAIARDEGFVINHAKTRIMPQSTRQRVTGLTVNRHVNLARSDFDRLKAILTNCARHGPENQNRDGHPTFRAHLDGRVGWAEQVNPHRGAKAPGSFRQDRLARLSARIGTRAGEPRRARLRRARTPIRGGSP